MVSKKYNGVGEAEADGPFIFWGGHLSLDFINTEVRNAEGGITDLLTGVPALRDWLSREGLPTDGADATGLMDAARSLRTALRAVLSAHVAGEPAPAGALGEVNAVLREGAGFVRLEAGGTGLTARRQRVEPSPLGPLLPVAEAAAELLTGEGAALVRRCGNPDCVLFFLDTSKNHTRRWCSMSGCGNRRKAAAHYERTRRAGASG